MTKIWFITGVGRGFGREFALAALRRGDCVAGTARDLEIVAPMVTEFGAEHFLPLQLDVTDREAVQAAVEASVKHFGRLDIVVNNAGYGLFGMVEEITPDALRAQLEVNLLGPLHVVQATLPILRQRRSGHIIQISTIGGICAFPNLGGYHASKWALEGLSESLAQEIAPFGIKVTLVEPGSFDTDWAGSSAVHADPQPHYEGHRAASRARQLPDGYIGDPAAAGPALLELVDATDPPLRALFGLMPVQMVPAVYERRLNTWKLWEPTALRANGPT